MQPSAGVNHYAFHDIDIAPEGATLAETEKIFHDVTDHALEHQKSSGVGLLWATQNLFSHPRFMNGGATNPNLDCYAWACAKTKMALDVGHKLGAENHVFWGGREGYQSTLNTDAKKELDNLAVRSPHYHSAQHSTRHTVPSACTSSSRNLAAADAERLAANAH
jgi:xylose isomerase